MLWKSRWTGDWFLRRAADQPRRARTQDNQILISAYDEIQTRRLVTTASSLVNVPSRPRVLNQIWKTSIDAISSSYTEA